MSAKASSVVFGSSDAICAISSAVNNFGRDCKMLEIGKRGQLNGEGVQKEARKAARTSAPRARSQSYRNKCAPSRSPPYRAVLCVFGVSSCIRSDLGAESEWQWRDGKSHVLDLVSDIIGTDEVCYFGNEQWLSIF